jgi:hypothetical protein
VWKKFTYRDWVNQENPHGNRSSAWIWYLPECRLSALFFVHRVQCSVSSIICSEKQSHIVINNYCLCFEHFLQGRVMSLLPSGQFVWKCSLSPQHFASSGCRWRRRPPDMGGGVAANILNKQSRTVNKGWSYSMGVGRGANRSSPWKAILLRNVTQGLEIWRIIWKDIRIGKWMKFGTREDNITTDLGKTGWEVVD